MTKYLVFFLAICTVFGVTLGIGDEDIRCVEKSCQDATCNPVPTKCTTNETNPGVYMLSPDICNCCDYCLVNLAEGEACSIGDPSNAKHSSICGPGLSCVVEKDGQTDGTCQTMSTSCTLEQISYDNRTANGSLGSLETRAICDDDGLYGNYKCIPGQTCYCLYSNGTRIFGEANYNAISNYMSCACSRAYMDAVDILGRDLHPHEHFRCASDGRYDRLQCINEKCLCVDAQDGAPTYPNNDLVNITDISNDTLPCATSSQYYRKCEEEYMKIYKVVEAKKNEFGYSLVLGYKYPDCDLDGTYAAVQENKTHKYCVDKEGELLSTALEKNDTLAPTMDCKCERAKLIMTATEKPSCLKNGNYSPIQCRRGICRCVDSNGDQKCSKGPECEVEESLSSKLQCA